MSESERLWSPWFRIIMEKRGYELWDDLDEALKEGGKYVRPEEILYFDPPDEHVPKYPSSK